VESLGSSQKLFIYGFTGFLISVLIFSACYSYILKNSRILEGEAFNSGGVTWLKVNKVVLLRIGTWITPEGRVSTLPPYSGAAINGCLIMEPFGDIVKVSIYTYEGNDEIAEWGFYGRYLKEISIIHDEFAKFILTLEECLKNTQKSLKPAVRTCDFSVMIFYADGSMIWIGRGADIITIDEAQWSKNYADITILNRIAILEPGTVFNPFLTLVATVVNEHMDSFHQR